MVQRRLKIPKHGGPDGQGLPQTVFDQLTVMFDNSAVDDAELRGAIELCLAISTQTQWNDIYREQLLKRVI